MICNKKKWFSSKVLVKMFNCPLHRSKIGEANVTEMMQHVGAVIGGEGNGGRPGKPAFVFFFRDLMLLGAVADLSRSTPDPWHVGFRSKRRHLDCHPRELGDP